METLHFIGWWLLISLIVGVAVGHAIRNTRENFKRSSRRRDKSEDLHDASPTSEMPPRKFVTVKCRNCGLVFNTNPDAPGGIGGYPPGQCQHSVMDIIN